MIASRFAYRNIRTPNACPRYFLGKKITDIDMRLIESRYRIPNIAHARSEQVLKGCCQIAATLAVVLFNSVLLLPPYLFVLL